MRISELAPAGTPIGLRDLARWAGRIPRPDAALEGMRAEICRRFRVRHCFFVSSGRASLYLLLRLLRERATAHKNEVVIPSYTCYSVPAAAIRAGLRVRVCDIDPRTLSLDLRQLGATDWERVLAVVTANLYGMPNDLPAIAAIVKSAGAFLIDDAAQSLNARIGDRYAGTFGDAGIYSLDKGKNITTIQGGLIVTDSDEVAGRLRALLRELPHAARRRTLSQAVQLLVYALFLRPALYRLPASLPFLGLGGTVYSTEYPVENYSPLLGAFGSVMLQHIDEFTRLRQRNARDLLYALADVPWLTPIETTADAHPVYARLPLLADNAPRRDRLVEKLRRLGLGASFSYPLATVDIPEVRAHLASSPKDGDGGRSVAARILTLPTHPYVSASHIAAIADAVRTVTGEIPSTRQKKFHSPNQ